MKKDDRILITFPIMVILSIISIFLLYNYFYKTNIKIKESNVEYDKLVAKCNYSIEMSKYMEIDLESCSQLFEFKFWQHDLVGLEKTYSVHDLVQLSKQSDEEIYSNLQIHKADLDDYLSNIKNSLNGKTFNSREKYDILPITIVQTSIAYLFISALIISANKLIK